MSEKLCFIGPISLEQAHLIDNNEFKNDKPIDLKGNIYTTRKPESSETFALYGKNYEIKQIIGLCKGQEVLWVDTSSVLNEDQFKHKGWYLLAPKDLELWGPEYAKLVVEGRCISNEEQEFFEQDYTLLNELPYDYVLDVPDPNPPGVNNCTSQTYLATYWNSNGALVLDTGTKTNTREPTAVTDYDPGSGYDVGWINQGNVKAGVSGYSNTGSCTTFTNSKYLRPSAFNNPIPTNTTVLGIKLRSRLYTDQPGHTKTYSVRFKTDVYSAVKSATLWDTTEFVNIDVGSGTDMWGSNASTLTPTRINGATLDVWGTLSSGHQWRVDQIIMYVNWRYTNGTYTRYHTADNGRSVWGQIQVTQSVPSGCSVVWNIYRASDNVLLLGNQTGTAINISSIAHVDLKIVATLNGNGTSTPSITGVTVTES